MFPKLKQLNQRWMRLEPTHQFMVWVVLGLIFSGLTLLAFVMSLPMLSFLSVPVIMGVVGAGILFLSGVFVSAIIYLTVYWPHHYRAYQDKRAI